MDIHYPWPYLARLQAIFILPFTTSNYSEVMRARGSSKLVNQFPNYPIVWHGHAVDKGWKQNQSKKSWMLPSESESEKPLLQLSYAVIVPKVFANSSSDKCSSLSEIINWKVSGWSWKWALLFRTAYKAKYVQSSRPAVPRQAFFFQDIFLLLLLCSSSPPWPNVPFQTSSSINYPVLLLLHWSDDFFLQIFSNSTKKSSSTCFSFSIFSLYKYAFFLFHHRSLSSKKKNIFHPFLLHYSHAFFFSSTKI